MSEDRANEPRYTAAGWSVYMIRPDLTNIRQVPFPPGFSIRPMRGMEEADLWTDIQRDAEEFLPITDTLFAEQFGSHPDEIPRRCFFVVDAEGAAVGAISAWFSADFKGRDHGRIHWVAIRPAYQRRGLGTTALSYALRRLAEWHDRAYLTTNTKRVPAIRLYLDFGFRPDLDRPGAPEAWREVRDRLDHPLLMACLGGA